MPAYKEPYEICYTQNEHIDHVTGSVTVDVCLKSVKGNHKTLRITFDQYDIRQLAIRAHEGLKQVELTAMATRQTLTGERTDR